MTAAVALLINHPFVKLSAPGWFKIKFPVTVSVEPAAIVSTPVECITTVATAVEMFSVTVCVPMMTVSLNPGVAPPHVPHVVALFQLPVLAEIQVIAWTLRRPPRKKVERRRARNAKGGKEKRRFVAGAACITINVSTAALISIRSYI